MNYRYIVIWLNKNQNQFYYKKVKGAYMKYEVGYVNQYNHEVVFIIDVSDLINHKVPIKKKVLTKLISFLQKINR